MKESGGDELVSVLWLKKGASVSFRHDKGEGDFSLSAFTIGKRSQRGDKIPKKRIGSITEAWSKNA